MKTITKLWIGLAVLILISPLGIILPARFGAGSAWGEWGADELQKLVGYMPTGMKSLSERWIAPMPDYGFRGQTHAQSGSYVLSGIIGAALVVALTLMVGKLMARREDGDPS